MNGNLAKHESEERSPVNLYCGESLIYVISQPRAGSTLLQRVLGSHPDVHTVAEPWLMLHPLYALRNVGYQAEYNEKIAHSALEGFIKSLPGGEDDYVNGLRRMCSYLYGRALTFTGKRYFLDKTPRYYFIIPELFRIFPKARYIVLLRNPLAVISSIISTWVKGEWSRLYNHEYDLIKAPQLLLEAVQHVGDSGIVVHYEQLVGQPEAELDRICNHLGLEFVPEMINYGRKQLPHWNFGDQLEVYEYLYPTSRNSDKWVRTLSNPQVWRLTSDYLKFLGEATVEEMGYSYDELLETLVRHRPGRLDQLFTASPAFLSSEPRAELTRKSHFTESFVHSLRFYGIKGTARRVARQIASAMPIFD